MTWYGEQRCQISDRRNDKNVTKILYLSATLDAGKCDGTGRIIIAHSARDIELSGATTIHLDRSGIKELHDALEEMLNETDGGLVR